MCARLCVWIACMQLSLLHSAYSYICRYIAFLRLIFSEILTLNFNFKHPKYHLKYTYIVLFQLIFDLNLSENSVSYRIELKSRRDAYRENIIRRVESSLSNLINYFRIWKYQ